MNEAAQADCGQNRTATVSSCDVPVNALRNIWFAMLVWPDTINWVTLHNVHIHRSPPMMIVDVGDQWLKHMCVAMFAASVALI